MPNCQTVKPVRDGTTGIGYETEIYFTEFQTKIRFIFVRLSQISLPSKLLEDRTTGPLVDDFKIIVPAVTFRGYSISKACSKVAWRVLAQYSTKAELLARTRLTIMAEEDEQMEVQGEEEVGFVQSFCITDISSRIQTFTTSIFTLHRSRRSR